MKAELDKRKVKYPANAKKNALEALLREHGVDPDKVKKEEAPEEKKESDSLEVKDDATITVDPTKTEYEKVDIYGLRDDHTLGYVRTYSREMHGAEYIKLANDFITNPRHGYRSLRMEPHNPDAVKAAGGER